MAKKKAKKKDIKKKDLKKKDKKKKSQKKKDLKKKDLKKKLGKKKSKKKDSIKKTSKKKISQSKESVVKKTETAASPIVLNDHSSNYNVREANKMLRALKSPEEIRAFTKGETRLTVNRVVTAVLRHFEN
jgi:hypothetical protein